MLELDLPSSGALSTLQPTAPPAVICNLRAWDRAETRVARRAIACTSLAQPRRVDRLFDTRRDRDEPLLAQLADVELALERHRHVRRTLIGGAATASVACWIVVRFALVTLAWAAPLFAFCALAVVSQLVWERALARRRCRLLARLPAAMRPPFDREEPPSRPERVRRVRELTTAGVALFGVFPFLLATLPRPWPLAIVLLTPVWKGLVCARLALSIHERFHACT